MVSIKKTNLYRTLLQQVQHLLRREHMPFVYVAIGDSTVAGVGASQLERTYTSLVHADVSLSFKGATYLNLGKSGARVQDVARDQLAQTIAANPDLITLSVGANDILRHTKLSVFQKELTNLIEMLQRHADALIVVTNIPNFSLLRVIPIPLKPIAEYRIRRFNAVILKVATAHELVHIDAFRHTTIFAKQFPQELVYKDGFHPSDLGYALWANTILITLQDKLAIIKEHRSHANKPTVY